MTERPVMFREASIRKILAGEKDLTRRTGESWAKVKPGWRLWAKETWRLAPDVPAYRADYPEERWKELGPWRSSMYMPRVLSRIDLEVVSVREERVVLGGGLGQMAVVLPGVDDDEARREGFGSRRKFIAGWNAIHPPSFLRPGPEVLYRVEFRLLEAA